MYLCVIIGFHIYVNKICVNIGVFICVNIVGAKCKCGITRFSKRQHRHAVCTYKLAGVWQIPSKCRWTKIKIQFFKPKP
jgi:hypothetical protein